MSFCAFAVDLKKKCAIIIVELSLLVQNGFFMLILGLFCRLYVKYGTVFFVVKEVHSDEI